MQVVYFYNFSDQPFSYTPYDFNGKMRQDENCRWNGEAYSFAPGSKSPMEDWRASHFAKHLANREVVKLPGGDTHTSPKFPEQDPFFFDLFKKALLPINASVDVAPDKIQMELAKQMAQSMTEPKEEAPEDEPVEKPKVKAPGKKLASKVVKANKPADEDSFAGLKE